MFCYTNSAHTGDALLIYTATTSGSTYPILTLSCPNDHPYWHKPYIRVTSWAYSAFTYP
jgi:hypothetical protein